MSTTPLPNRMDGDGSAAIDDARLAAVAQGLLERNRQLEHALESRVVIEQAKGVLAERFGLDVDQAFEVLRRAARSNRLRIHALAAEVVKSPTTPTPIDEHVRRARF